MKTPLFYNFLNVRSKTYAARRAWFVAYKNKKLRWSAWNPDDVVQFITPTSIPEETTGEFYARNNGDPEDNDYWFMWGDEFDNGYWEIYEDSDISL